MKRQIHLVFAITCFATNASHADPGVTVARAGLPSTVLIVGYDENGIPNALGSGFVAANSTIATNLHVIEKARTLTVHLIGDEVEHAVDHIRAVDSINDLVLLNVSNINSDPITIPETSFVAVGTSVFALGNPRGLEGTISNGIISAVRKFEDRELIQHTASISSGSSGGPILDENGNLVGIAVSSLENGQNLNFAVPAKFLVDLMTVEDEKIPVSALASKETTHESTSQILIQELWGSIYSAAIAGDRELLLEGNWIDRLGYFRCIVSLENLNFEQASVVPIDTGPFNGTFKVTIPSVKPITYENWDPRVDAPISSLPDTLTQESDIQFHCLSFESAANAVKELKRLSSTKKGEK